MGGTTWRILARNVTRDLACVTTMTSCATTSIRRSTPTRSRPPNIGVDQTAAGSTNSSNVVATSASSSSSRPTSWRISLRPRLFARGLQYDGAISSNPGAGEIQSQLAPSEHINHSKSGPRGPIRPHR